MVVIKLGLNISHKRQLIATVCQNVLLISVVSCSATKLNIIRTEKCSLDWAIRGSLIINWIIIIVLVEHLVQKHGVGIEVRKEDRKYRVLLEGKRKRHTVFDNNWSGTLEKRGVSVCLYLKVGDTWRQKQFEGGKLHLPSQCSLGSWPLSRCFGPGQRLLYVWMNSKFGELRCLLGNIRSQGGGGENRFTLSVLVRPGKYLIVPSRRYWVRRGKHRPWSCAGTAASIKKNSGATTAASRAKCRGPWARMWP